ncbi:MAG: hypothetical protein K8W52_46815 [Deltaproteobacteria bacterium]|nr:hypothetical protein [Deltaproteobacteria bacterium]
MKKFVSDVVNIRRALFAGATLALAACGGDPSRGDGPDARPAAIDAVAVSECEAVADDLSPTPTPGPADGIYTESSPLDNRVRPMCTVADDHVHTYSYYVEIDRGRAIAYRRVYLPGEGCGLSFDGGGVKEIIEETVLRGCGPRYTTAEGSFQQVVELRKRDDGSVARSYRFFGDGPTDARWRDVILSGLASSDPFDGPPEDIHFLTYRRALP